MFALGALYHDLTEALEKQVDLVTTERFEHSANVARTKRFRSNIERVQGYWDEMAAFVRNLFNSTFKTNPYMERAVMTGITRISRESIFPT